MKTNPTNALAQFAKVCLCVGGSMAIGAFVSAQEKAPPASTLHSESTQNLSDDSLKKMLTDMGYTVKNLSKGYQISISQNKWTFNIQVMLSDNKAKLGLNTVAGDVPEPGDVPAASWLSLLEANPDIDPTTFYFDKDQKRLLLHRACDNRGITSDILRKEIDTFCADVARTVNLWNFTK